MPINRMPTKDFINVKQRNRLDSLITDNTPNCSEEIIKKVRDIINVEFEKNPNDFDLIDVERFQKSDWTVTRFLLRKKENVEEAAKMMIACAKWRHRLGMPRWKDEDFPEEFYKIGGVFPYEQDTLGNTTIYVRAKLYDKKLTCIQELFRRYLIHIANRVDEERDGRGWAIIFDCSGAGYANLDVNMLLFMMNEVVPHLPKGLNYVLIYELPWLLSKIVNGTVACLPYEYKKLVKTASKKDLSNWVSKEALPDFMGGTCDINYRRTPPGCLKLREMADRLKFSETDLELIDKVYKSYIEEADEAIARRKSKQLRRRSSVLEFWHWMKNKIPNNQDNNADNADSENNDNTNNNNNNEKQKSAPVSQINGKQWISVGKKDQSKLAAITDECDE